MPNEKIINNRQSGIEFLKMIAMFGIVIAHCVQSIANSDDFILSNINIGHPTTNFTNFITQIMYYFGMIGNSIFLICSVWFLIDGNNIRVNKIAHMILNNYVFSVIFMLIFITGGVTLAAKEVIKQLFPITFANNWYITCYLLLYAIHPTLNMIINKLTQRQHLKYNCAFFILYFCIGSITASYFINDLICFIVIYFIVAYIKRYNSLLISRFKVNFIFLLIGIILLFVLQLGMNFVGFHINAIGQKMFHFSTNHNPIILIISISMFNIFRELKFQSKIINYIASLTMLIYIIHENYLFRRYLRAALLYDFWVISNRMNIVLFVLIFSAVLFIASTIIAIVYNKLFQTSVHKLAEKILQLVLKFYGKIEKFILRLN